MSDYISRADAIEMAVDVETPQGTYERAIYVDDLMALPSTDRPIKVRKDGTLFVKVLDVSKVHKVEVYDNGDLSKQFGCSADSPILTEEVREALMRLTMCAREECGMCKYKDDCDFDKQYEMATDNMHTILNAFKCVSAESYKDGYDDGIREERPKAYKIGYNDGYERGKAECVSAERVGEWQRKLVHYTDGSHGYRLKCSACEEEWLSETNYCPSCGARMTPYKGGDDE